MRASAILASLLGCSLTLAASAALAQSQESTKAPPAKAAAAADAPTPRKSAAAGKQRKDPEGRTGISPYMEQIAKGEAAFVARDFPGAVEAFQDAIKLDGQKMLGFYRLGETQLASGKVDEADATWQAGLGKKGTEDLSAKLLFVLADLRERQGKWPPAKEAWGAYTTFLQSNPKALGYPATAIERQRQIDRRVKDEKDYGEVKERIAKRQAEKEAEAIDNAKKDKLNR